jgi:hypothetical protein
MRTPRCFETQNPFDRWRSFVLQKDGMQGRISKGVIHPSYLCRSRPFAGQHHVAAAVPSEKRPVALVQETCWVLGSVSTARKILPHRDSIQDHPARSNTLYRPHYPYLQEELVCFLIPVFRTLFDGNNLICTEWTVSLLRPFFHLKVEVGSPFETTYNFFIYVMGIPWRKFSHNDV